MNHRRRIVPQSNSRPFGSSWCGDAEEPQPFNPMLLPVLGWLELGNPTEAERELSELPVEVAEAEAAYHLRVMIAVRAGDPRHALRTAIAFTRAHPLDPTAWVRLAAVTLIPCGRPDWAVRALKTGLVGLPEHPMLETALAEAATLSEDRDLGGCGRKGGA